LNAVSSTAIEQLERRANGRSFLELRLSSTSGVNPMSGSTVAGIREILRTQAANPDLHGLFISAEGRLFCAGADVKEFAAFDVQDFRAYMTDILAMYLEMTRFPKPIASLVHADALGAGAALAFFSDFVLAAKTVRFGLPEVQRGLAGGGYLMARMLGRQLAAEWVMLGRPFTAADAQRMGLVNEVCDASEIEARAAALAAELATLQPSGLAVAKKSLAGGFTTDLESAMQLHVAAQTEAFEKMRTGR
jgi:enoyl-CoA hydratase/carnithine racemase